MARIETIQFLPLPLGLEVRTSTLVGATLIFGLVWWRSGRPLLAFVVLAAWISTYEAVYTGTGAALGRWAWLYAIAACGGLGWAGWAWALGNRPQVGLLILFALAWLVWVLAGFHANDHLRIVSGTQEVFNVTTKSILGLSYALGRIGAAGEGVKRLKLSVASR